MPDPRRITAACPLAYQYSICRSSAFTVTRDGHRIGELVPLRQRRRFVSRAEFAAMSRSAQAIGADAFRADQDTAADQAGTAMTAEPGWRGLLDTNIMILRSRIAPEELPDEMAISAVRLAELSAGPHEVAPIPDRTSISRLPSGLAGWTYCSGLSTSSTRFPSTRTPPGPMAG